MNTGSEQWWGLLSASERRAVCPGWVQFQCLRACLSRSICLLYHHLCQLRIGRVLITARLPLVSGGCPTVGPLSTHRVVGFHRRRGTVDHIQSISAHASLFLFVFDAGCAAAPERNVAHKRSIFFTACMK